VTPSFNQARFLEQTITSVLDQRYPRLEYIIMDGGSTDGSVDIIRKYARHLHYWQCQRDGGQAAAVLDGWKKGTGNLLGWLNSDDLLLAGSLESVARAADDRHHLYYGDLLSIDESGRVLHYAAMAHPPDWCLRNGLLFTGQPGNFYDRALCEKVGFFDRTLKCAMECDIVTRLLQAGGRSRLVPRPMAALRQYGGTKTQTMGDVIRREMRLVYGRNARGLFRNHAIREFSARVVVYGNMLRYVNPLNVRRVVRKARVRLESPNVAAFLD
jgi:glycosyltransferase involved in cell wall biosynthesis